MSIANVMEAYKAMGQEDKAALAELKREEEKRVGHTLQLGDVIRATTPGMPDPEYLTAAK